MPRGGKREKAGRKSTWASGRKIEDTTIIRVPKEYAAHLLEIAHKLDSGEILEFVTESKKCLEEENENLRRQLADLSERVACLSFQLQIISAKQLHLDLFLGQESVADLGQEPLSVEPEVLPNSVGSLKTDELAKRLKVGSQAITSARKNKSLNFGEWSRKKDPEGIAWKYVKGKVFQPILENT